MKNLLLILFAIVSTHGYAQTKKPLDHSVYDGWKSLNERMISRDGRFIVYTINPQEGDGELVIENPELKYSKRVPRGNSAVITEDSKYVIFKIKPLFQDTRQAKIKKKKSSETPKDSLGIVELGKDTIYKVPGVKSFKTPEKGSGWLAYLLEKPIPDSATKKKTDSLKAKTEELLKLADSVLRISIDSLKGNVDKQKLLQVTQKAAKEILKKSDAPEALDAEGDEGGSTSTSEGTDLVLRKLNTGEQKRFKLVSEFYFDKKGNQLILETTKPAKDTLAKALVLWYNLLSEKTDTVMKGFNDSKQFTLDETGEQLAFLAERDSVKNALQKFYKLWYYRPGFDTARILVDKYTVGMEIGHTVSENGSLTFSRDGRKLYFGTAAVRPPKDTTIIDFETARLDVWHYNDDYLQPQQLKQLDAELKRSYLAVTRPGTDNKVIQLGDRDAETTMLVDEGNASFVLASSTKGNRVASQWLGRSVQSSYIISTEDGSRKLLRKDALTFVQASPKGKFVYWYEPDTKHYFTYEVATGTIRNISSGIKVPLYDTENDVPDYPRPAGSSGWTDNDSAFLINDEFDIWRVDPFAKMPPVNITQGIGRTEKETFEYVVLDVEKRSVGEKDTVLLSSFNKLTKQGGYYSLVMNGNAAPQRIGGGPYSYNSIKKAELAQRYILQRSNINESELFVSNDLKQLQQLTHIADQQQPYNWLTVELVKWKMFDGKMSEGILYKPADFDPKKKYPVIFYFYERNTDNLFQYKAPAPSASIINIPYFVSNGYLVFDPNIYYKKGEPGQSAYNSVVSAAKYLSKMPFVDSNRLALQGQSWGGYQIAYLVTKTNIFRAAGAGAPVANMTSAYGGIRWGSGMNRQFQYEKTQSRIGYTLWQRPDLYLKNSPLFAADKVKTPLLIMHNDADDAVPWYQGIEYFTALRRLGKKVWMLQYNGETHNLQERRNRKDLSIRLQQFFDYYLKDAPAPRWLQDGLPAIEKGTTMGLELE